MDFETALAAELEGITVLGGRVYPLTAPEGTGKLGTYAIYVSNNGMPTKELGGFVGGRRVPLEIHVFSARYGNIKAAGAAVEALLADMEKRQIGTGGPFIQEVTVREPVELYEDAAKLYHGVHEFEVYF